MNTESKDKTTQTTNQINDNSPESMPDSGSDQNRSGIMDNAMGKTDDIFEDQNVPNEGEVGNTANDESVYIENKDPKPGNDADDEDDDMDDSDDIEPDEDFDLEDVDLDETDLDDDVLKDMDEEDDLDEDVDEDPFM